MPAIGSLILFSSKVEAILKFYRAIGVPFAPESHEESGPTHYAADLNGVHVALYESGEGNAQRWRDGGCTWPGFVVEDVPATLQNVTALGAKVLGGPEERPWGIRAVVEDPDGRPVEIWSSGDETPTV